MPFSNRIYKFVVDGKPPIKRRPRGRTHYTPKATVEDEQRVRDAFLASYPIPPRSEARFSVEIKIYTDRNVDGDNIEKAVLDSLIKVLWENDRQVRQMTWWIIPVQQAEGIEVRALEF